MWTINQIVAAPWHFLRFVNYGHATKYTAEDASDAHRIDPLQAASNGERQRAAIDIAGNSGHLHNTPYHGWGGNHWGSGGSNG